MSREEGRRIALALGVRAGYDVRIEIERRTPSGRASLVRIGSGGVSRVMKAFRLRREAGYARVKSLWMEIVPVGGGWLFMGNGYGHGVGMCQWGANGMAKWGAEYPEILARYYPQTRIASLPRGFGSFARGAGGDP
jgi:stage II sporulation protein D